MWISLILLSIILTVINLLMVFRNKRTEWICISAITCACLSLISQDQNIYRWVNEQDWGALMDVIPYTYPAMSNVLLMIVVLNIGISSYQKLRSKGIFGEIKKV